MEEGKKGGKLNVQNGLRTTNILEQREWLKGPDGRSLLPQTHHSSAPNSFYLNTMLLTALLGIQGTFLEHLERLPVPVFTHREKNLGTRKGWGGGGGGV